VRSNITESIDAPQPPIDCSLYSRASNKIGNRNFCASVYWDWRSTR